MSSTGRVSALDYLRHVAAGAVLFSHSYVLIGASNHDPLQRFIDLDAATIAVDFFFCLSGFLMHGALQRDTHVPRFLRNRIARIAPGLVVCTLLTATLLGPLATTLDAGSYWASRETWSYLRNAIFVFTPGLPGVYEDNPYPSVVNGSLWTLSYEIACYLSVAALAAFSSRLRTAAFGLIAAGATFWLAMMDVQGPTLASNLSRLLALFALGYVAGEGPVARRWICTGLALCLAVSWLLEPATPHRLTLQLLAALACIGLLHLSPVMSRRLPALPFDFSFGIYIYAFPIQQWLAGSLPGADPLLFFGISMILTLPAAAISWYAVERPALQSLKRLSSRTPREGTTRAA